MGKNIDIKIRFNLIYKIKSVENWKHFELSCLERPVSKRVIIAQIASGLSTVLPNEYYTLIK